MTPRPTAAPTRVVALTTGLVVDVPAAWTLEPVSYVNMGTVRYLFAGNGEIASLATREGNGDIDPAKIPTDRVVVEVEAFCRLACAGPTTETSLPLEWKNASPRGQDLPAGRHAMALGFRWFDRPLYFIAAWSDLSPAADVAAIERVARSIRPETSPPQTGEFMGWQGLGALSGIPVGSVNLVQLPSGTPTASQTRFGAGPYYLVRAGENLYAFVTRPLVERRCEIQFDAGADRFWCQVDARRYEWTRFGRFLGPEPASDLGRYGVIVREGQVWVRYVQTASFVPNDESER